MSAMGRVLVLPCTRVRFLSCLWEQTGVARAGAERPGRRLLAAKVQVGDDNRQNHGGDGGMGKGGTFWLYFEGRANRIF